MFIDFKCVFFNFNSYQCVFVIVIAVVAAFLNKIIFSFHHNNLISAYVGKCLELVSRK